MIDMEIFEQLFEDYLVIQKIVYEYVINDLTHLEKTFLVFSMMSILCLNILTCQ